MALVGRGPRGLLGRDLGVLRRAGLRRRTSGCSAAARCPARSGSRARGCHYAEHVFRGRDDDAVAIRHAGELRELSQWTWGELREQTAASPPGCGRSASGPGDRVAAYMPNIPETIAAFLACASIGAVWSSAAPDFGARSVIDRFAQIEPKVLLAVDGYRYGGRDYDRSEAVAGIAGEIGAEVVRFGYLDGSGWPDGARRRRRAAELRAAPVRASAVGALLLRHDGPAEADRPQPGRDPARAPQEAAPAPRRAGRRPGLLVHDDRLDDVELPRLRAAHGGVDRALRRQSRHPDMDVLWDLAERTGDDDASGRARLHRACMKAGVEPRDGRDLSALRAVGSTGSPLSPEGFGWVYEHVGSDTWLFSTSGGTDLCTAFVGGCRRCRSTRASCRRARWAPRSSPGTRTASRTSARSASS